MPRIIPRESSALALRIRELSPGDLPVDFFNEKTAGAYLRRSWLPVLKPLRFMVLQELRRLTYYQRRDGVAEPVTEVRQRVLAETLGVGRQTVLKALKDLEAYGFIGKTKTRDRYAPLRYTVYSIPPLIPEDVERVLSKKATPPPGPRVFFSRQGVEKSPPYVEKVDSLTVNTRDLKKRLTLKRSRPSLADTARSVGASPLIADLVAKTPASALPPGAEKDTSKGRSPRLRELTPEKVALARDAARKAGEMVGELEGARPGSRHRSEVFFTRVALADPGLLAESVAALRDHVESGREVRRSAGALLGGIIKRRARERGINLGLNSGGKT